MFTSSASNISGMDKSSSVNLLEQLKKRFNSKAAQNLSATYLFQINGLEEGSGSFMTKINRGEIEVLKHEPGITPKPDCTITVSAEDLAKIFSGKLSAMTAALSGLLAVDGDLGLAMQLVPVFFEG